MVFLCCIFLHHSAAQRVQHLELGHGHQYYHPVWPLLEEGGRRLFSVAAGSYRDWSRRAVVVQVDARQAMMECQRCERRRHCDHVAALRVFMPQPNEESEEDLAAQNTAHFQPPILNNGKRINLHGLTSAQQESITKRRRGQFKWRGEPDAEMSSCEQCGAAFSEAIIPHCEVSMLLSSSCTRKLPHSARIPDMQVSVYTVGGVEELQAYKGPCSNPACHNERLWDGFNDAIFRYSDSIAVVYEVMRLLVSMLSSGTMPFRTFHRALQVLFSFRSCSGVRCTALTT
jgi:hypothetical protein